MGGVERDEAHAFPDAVEDTIDDGIIYLSVRGVTPPEQDIGVVDGFFGAALLGVVEGGGGDGEFGEFFEVSGDRSFAHDFAMPTSADLAAAYWLLPMAPRLARLPTSTMRPPSAMRGAR